MCHKVGGVGVGVPGGIGMPDDHVNRPNSICTGCHLPADPQTTNNANAAPTAIPAAVHPTAAPTEQPVATATAQATVTANTQTQLPVTATVVAGASASLPSAGEPLEDTGRAAIFAAAGVLLLFLAVALQRMMSRS